MLLTRTAGRILRALAIVLLAGSCTAGRAASPAGSAAAVPPRAQETAPPQPPARQPRLEDFIAAPGSTAPFMLHADLWQGIDQRAKLDTIVFVLQNGARTCKVLDRDSTWAVDYTWVYPHTLFPPRWYDARSLIATGDSLKLPDDADIKLTFGTLRTSVHAGSLAQATSEAYRRWPETMSPALAGRLRLKLERAKKALAGKTETEPGVDTPH